MKTVAMLLMLPAMAGMAACSHDAGTAPVPRPRAYPRIELTGGGTRTIDVAGVSIAVDSAAEAAEGDGGALTVNYAAEGATLFLSVRTGLHDGALADALANRRERMALNLGGAVGRTDTFLDSAGYNCLINRALEAGVPTPVQLLAWNDSLGTLVWGAFVWHTAPESTDSVAPVADALYAKAFKILESL